MTSHSTVPPNCCAATLPTLKQHAIRNELSGESVAGAFETAFERPSADMSLCAAVNGANVFKPCIMPCDGGYWQLSGVVPPETLHEGAQAQVQRIAAKPAAMACLTRRLRQHACTVTQDDAPLMLPHRFRGLEHQIEGCKEAVKALFEKYALDFGCEFAASKVSV